MYTIDTGNKVAMHSNFSTIAHIVFRFLCIKKMKLPPSGQLKLIRHVYLIPDIIAIKFPNNNGTIQSKLLGYILNPF